MSKLGESVVYIKANRQHLVAGMKTAYKGVVTSTALMQSQLNKLNFKAFGNKLNTVTRKIVKWGSVIGVAVAGFTLKKAIGEFAKFETALVDTQKITTESICATIILTFTKKQFKNFNQRFVLTFTRIQKILKMSKH